MRFAIAATGLVPLLLIGAGTAQAAEMAAWGGTRTLGVNITGLQPNEHCNVDVDNHRLSDSMWNYADETGKVSLGFGGQSEIGALAGRHTVHAVCDKGGDLGTQAVVVSDWDNQFGPASGTITSGLSGQYTAAAADGSFATTWTVTDCGPGCLHIASSQGGSTDAHYQSGFWRFSLVQDEAVKCPGSPLIVGGTLNYSIDEGFHRGNIDATDYKCPPTGLGMSPTPFTLTKIG